MKSVLAFVAFTTLSVVGPTVIDQTILKAVAIAKPLKNTLKNTEPIVFIWARSPGMDRPLGSGFLLGRSGDLLTASHVVESRKEGENLVVSISSKSENPVEVDMAGVDCDKVQDFCFLRIQRDVGALRRIKKFFQFGCHIPERGSTLIAAAFFAGKEKASGVVTPDGTLIGDEIKGGLLPVSIPLESSMSGGPVFDENFMVIGLVKGGTDKFGYIQPLQLAQSGIEGRGYRCGCNSTLCSNLYKANELGIHLEFLEKMKEIGADPPESALNIPQHYAQDLGIRLSLTDALVAEDPKREFRDLLSDKGSDVVDSFRLGSLMATYLIYTTAIEKDKGDVVGMSSEGQVLELWKEDSIVINRYLGDAKTEQQVSETLGQASDIKDAICDLKTAVNRVWQRPTYQCGFILDAIRKGLADTATRTLVPIRPPLVAKNSEPKTSSGDAAAAAPRMGPSRPSTVVKMPQNSPSKALVPSVYLPDPIIADLESEDVGTRKGARKQIVASGVSGAKRVLGELRPQHKNASGQVQFAAAAILLEIIRNDANSRINFLQALRSDDLEWLINLSANGEGPIRVYASQFLYDLGDPRTIPLAISAFPAAREHGKDNLALVLKGSAMFVDSATADQVRVSLLELKLGAKTKASLLIDDAIKLLPE